MIIPYKNFVMEFKYVILTLKINSCLIYNSIMKNVIQLLYQNILHVIGKIIFTYDNHIIFYYKLKYLKMYFVDSQLVGSE